MCSKSSIWDSAKDIAYSWADMAILKIFIDPWKVFNFSGLGTLTLSSIILPGIKYNPPPLPEKIKLDWDLALGC